MSGDNAEEILGAYKKMMAECQQIASKVQELTLEKDEHKLVIEQLSKLEPERKAFRLIGGVLVEKTVGEALPQVQQNFDGISELITTLDGTLKKKDEERKAYKEKHGIMTQDEREAMMKRQQQQARSG
mmetsp:Transcript_30793/g.51516  ORF Transcript_30793/g.51516 Transcript_30793/m.51516 type:complete len:128 (+) Transcript_30793:106-489(+)